MKRRDLILASTAIATGAGVVGALSRSNRKDVKPSIIAASSDIARPAINKGLKEFRMVTSWPKDFPGLGQMANRFAAGLGEISEGRINVKVFAAGELVGAAECFDAAATGAADMYHAAEYYWQGKSKGFSFFTAVPMGMTAAEIMGWIDHGGGQALWDDLSAQFNIKAFQAGNTGHQAGGWFKREMNSLEDFKGLKMRMPGLGGDVIRRLGGAAVRLSGGEIYQALQSGNIDATEWVGPWNDIAFGFYREAPYYYAPGFHEPGASLSVGINLDIWNSFTATEQKMVSYAAQHANNTSLGEYTYENAKALDTLRREHGISPRFFSQEIMVEIGRVCEDVVNELGTSDRQTRRIYESYKSARDQYAKWTEMSDGRYIAARGAALASLQ
jgi:TRAP-type mannitol/chloroaromatic compound transport system substrate-binding protein